MNDDETPDVAAQMQNLGAEVAETSRVVNGQSLAPIVTRFYVIAETIDENGQRGLEAFMSDEVSVWDAVGMLSFELEVEKRKIEGPSRDDG